MSKYKHIESQFHDVGFQCSCGQWLDWSNLFVKGFTHDNCWKCGRTWYFEVELKIK